MEEWEVQAIQLKMLIKELRAWLIGIAASMPEDYNIRYGLDKIKEIEDILIGFQSIKETVNLNNIEKDEFKKLILSIVKQLND